MENSVAIALLVLGLILVWAFMNEPFVQHPSFASALVTRADRYVQDQDGWSRDDYRLYRHQLMGTDIGNPYITS